MAPEPPGGPAGEVRRTGGAVRRLVGRREAVVVGFCDTEASRRAVRWAAAEAWRRRALLRVVCVVDQAAVARHPPGDLVRSWLEARDRARRVAGAGARLAASSAPGLEVEVVAEVGAPVAALVGAGRRAAVLVLGHGVPTGAGEPGRVGAVVARRARGPVVLVPEPAVTDPGRPVVVGVDGSRESWRALDLGAGFAVSAGVPLRVVCAWAPGARGGTGWAPGGVTRRDPDAPAVAREVVAAAVDRLHDAVPRLQVDGVVEAGRADAVLADHARTAVVLVLGRRGHGGHRTLTLGSVSSRALRFAGVPVALAGIPVALVAVVVTGAVIPVG